MTAIAPEEEQLDILAARQQVILPRVNLLPPEVAERQAFRRLQAGLAVAVIATAGVVGLLYQQASGGLSGAESSLHSAQAQSVRLHHQISTYSNVTATKQQYEAVQAALAKAMGQEVRWSRYLNDLSITLPSNVWVTNLTVSESTPSASSSSGATTATSSAASAGSLGKITISGVAFSFNDVAVWLETLAREKGYTNPYLTQGQRTTIAGQSVISFTSTVNLSSGVLSNRYTTQAGN